MKSTNRYDLPLSSNRCSICVSQPFSGHASAEPSADLFQSVTSLIMAFFRAQGWARLLAEVMNARYDQIQARIETMYLDKLDGRITQEFFDKQSDSWRLQK